jgi:hypothetical protein
MNGFRGRRKYGYALDANRLIGIYLRNQYLKTGGRPEKPARSGNHKKKEQAVRRYSELTQEELVALYGDNERTQHFIDLEIAHAGIIPVEPPEPCDITEPDIKPTIEAFEVYGLVFMKQEDAITVSRLPAMVESYDYNIDSKYKFLKERISEYGEKGLVVKKYYKANDLDLIKGQLRDIKQRKEKHDQEMKKYDEYTKVISRLRDNVWNAISEARDEQVEFDRAKIVYEKHLKLSEGNEEIAKNFFREAYKSFPNIIEKVLGEKPAEKVAETK